jgi:hypothetical protein
MGNRCLGVAKQFAGLSGVTVIEFEAPRSKTSTSSVEPRRQRLSDLPSQIMSSRMMKMTPDINEKMVL